VKEVDLGEFDSEMLKENIFCAGPLVCGRGDLGLTPLFSERGGKERWDVHPGVSIDGSRGLRR